VVKHFNAWMFLVRLLADFIHHSNSLLGLQSIPSYDFWKLHQMNLDGQKLSFLIVTYFV